MSAQRLSRPDHLCMQSIHELNVRARYGVVNAMNRMLKPVRWARPCDVLEPLRRRFDVRDHRRRGVKPVLVELKHRQAAGGCPSQVPKEFRGDWATTSLWSVNPVAKRAGCRSFDILRKVVLKRQVPAPQTALSIEEASPPARVAWGTSNHGALSTVADPKPRIA